MVRLAFVPFILVVNLGVPAEEPTTTKRSEGNMLFTVVSNADSKGKWIQETHVISSDGSIHPGQLTQQELAMLPDWVEVIQEPLTLQTDG